MKLSRCCICFPIPLGVKILGALDFLYFLNAALRGDIMSLVLLLLPMMTFVYMLVEDCKQSRLYFFIAFAGYRLVLLCLFFFKVYLDFTSEPILDEQHAVKNRCEIYKKD